VATKTTHKTGGTQMVKQQRKNNRKNQSSKGFTANSAKARKIKASMEYETCDEQLSPALYPQISVTQYYL
jgi:hypothetical protein